MFTVAAIVTNGRITNFFRKTKYNINSKKQQNQINYDFFIFIFYDIYIYINQKEEHTGFI